MISVFVSRVVELLIILFFAFIATKSIKEVDDINAVFFP